MDDTRTQGWRKAYTFLHGAPDHTEAPAEPDDEPVDFRGELLYETPNYYHVGFDGRVVEIPKELSRDVTIRGRAISMTVPQWLAEDKELD